MLEFDTLLKLEDGSVRNIPSTPSATPPLADANASVAPQSPFSRQKYAETEANNIKDHRRKYENVSEITYSADMAIEEGWRMADEIEACLKTLSIVNKKREEVWSRELEGITSHRKPKTTIAICGATGVGKSSVLNAILEDNIIPTSCTRACTSVVTEISYEAHSPPEPKISADICFISRDEWISELRALLDDMTAGEGHAPPKHPGELRGKDAAIAWKKIHAVYPNVKFGEIIHMNVQQILDLDIGVLNTLGTVKELGGADSGTFQAMIRKYIDSETLPSDPTISTPGLLPASTSISKTKSIPANSKTLRPSAFWPLIRKVAIRCPSPVLSSGAVLVDLPGVADSNAARNNVAKEYMKEASCVWIVAPVTRAVDEKTAHDLMGEAFKLQLMMDGNYDDRAITFIATKVDELSPTEIARDLHLDNDPEYARVHAEVAALRNTKGEIQRKLFGGQALTEGLRDSGQQLKDLETCLQQKHLRAPEEASTVWRDTPSTTHELSTTSLKRKALQNSGSKSKKVKRAHPELIEQAAAVDDPESDELDLLIEPTTTTEDLHTELGSYQQGIAGVTAQLNKVVLPERFSPIQEMAIVQQGLSSAQRKLKGVCSLRRSEFAKISINSQFKDGLEEMWGDRDLRGTRLPIFTCSSREFAALKGLNNHDGEATCFSRIEDTGIPALQEWTRYLASWAADRDAKLFLARLNALSKSIQSWADASRQLTIEDIHSFRNKWKTPDAANDIHNIVMKHRAAMLDDAVESEDGDDDQADVADSEDGDEDEVDGENSEDGLGEDSTTGIVTILSKTFAESIDSETTKIKGFLRTRLVETCRLGASRATESAVDEYTSFCAARKWNTLRSTLFRHGKFKDSNLNESIVEPFTKAIAKAWAETFNELTFEREGSQLLSLVEELLLEIEQTAALGMQDRIRARSDSCLEEARGVMQDKLTRISASMGDRQKESSRSMAQSIQEGLSDGYEDIRQTRRRGPGSATKEKEIFGVYLDDNKQRVFDEGVDKLFRSLDQAVDSVGQSLFVHLLELAQKVENGMSVLWEEYQESGAQVRARQSASTLMDEFQGQLQLWIQATDLADQRKRREKILEY